MLDALRGAAALVVLLHHSLLTLPSFSPRGGYWPATSWDGGYTWLLIYTPLHLFWAGTQAVIVFFVLSGFVLAWPIASGRRLNLATYYPQRLVRLYVPVIAAVFLAVAWVIAVPRTRSSSYWMDLHVFHLTPAKIMQDLVLFPRPGWSNSALWSLQYEVAFSLALPLYLLVARRLLAVRRSMFIGCLALTPIGYGTHAPSIAYLATFGLGVSMAFAHPRGEEQRPIPRAPALIATVGAILLLVSDWTFGFTTAWPGVAGPTAGALIQVAQPLGGCLLVHLATRLATEPRAAFRWLGSRSFSLYLVHEPIVVSLATLLHGHLSALLTATIGVIVSLLSAEIFFRVIERPSHEFARSTGRVAARTLHLLGRSHLMGIWGKRDDPNAGIRGLTVNILKGLTGRRTALLGRLRSSITGKPRVAIFGDSFVQGAGASGSKGYAHLLRRDLEAVVIPLGSGGTGFILGCGQGTHYHGRLRHLVLADPHVAVIQASINDHHLVDDKIRAAAIDFLNLAQLALRNTRFVLLGPLWSSDAERLSRMRRLTATVAAETGVSYVDPDGWITSQSALALMAADRIHLSDQGHEVISSRLVAAIQAELMAASHTGS